MKHSPWSDRYGATALVTGASSGIGEQFADQLAQRGFNLWLVARRGRLLETLKQRLEKAYGIEVTCCVCDLSDLAQVDDLIAKLLPEDIGLVVSNAGYGVPKGAFLSVAVDAQEAMYCANSLAPARLAHAFLPGMLEKNRGAFIFTGSMEGDAVFPWSTPYAASKAFLHSLVQGLWQELADSNVDILLLAPGSTDTQAPVSQGISRDQLVGVMSPADVASQALDRLGKQPHFIPGWHNRLFIGLLRWLPRRAAISLAGYGMKQAIQNSRKGDDE